MGKLMSHEKTAINLRNITQYVRVMELFEEKGWKWYNEKLPTHDSSLWHHYKEYTCIHYANKFGYANIAYFSDISYKIITFEIFLHHWSEEFLLWYEYNEDFILKVDDI